MAHRCVNLSSVGLYIVYFIFVIVTLYTRNGEIIIVQRRYFYKEFSYRKARLTLLLCKRRVCGNTKKTRENSIFYRYKISIVIKYEKNELTALFLASIDNVKKIAQEEQSIQMLMRKTLRAITSKNTSTNYQQILPPS